jgi:hypothetical protein
MQVFARSKARSERHKDVLRLLAEWHHVRLARFHARGRNCPEAFIEIDLRPCSIDKFRLAYTRQQHEPQRHPQCWSTSNALQCCQEFANFVWRQGAVAWLGYEIQDHVRDLCGIVTKPGKMVSSIKFNELRAWNVFRQETATLDADGRILGPVQNQGRHADRRQDADDIDFTIHSHQALDRRILSNFWKLCGNPLPPVR